LGQASVVLRQKTDDRRQKVDDGGATEGNEGKEGRSLNHRGHGDHRGPNSVSSVCSVVKVALWKLADRSGAAATRIAVVRTICAC
jgi:hypothetical protein